MGRAKAIPTARFDFNDTSGVRRTVGRISDSEIRPTTGNMVDYAVTLRTCAEEVASIARAAGFAEGASRNWIRCEPATASVYSTLREKSSGKTRPCAWEPRG
jgi:hypothetical protein